MLYKDGELQKKFEGARDLKSLSAFVEETLETIRPGSRPIGGPKLPKVGASIVEGYESIVSAAPATPTAGSPSTPAVNTDEMATKTQPASRTLKATQVNKKPAKPTPTPNSVGQSVSLTAESFQNLVTMSQEPWFIKFYAPWCSHCQAMAPNWLQLGKEMKGKLNIGEVNCDVETRLCKDVRLRGYPTILFFRGGERVEYDGLRGLGDLVTYAEKAIDIGDGVKDVDAVEFKEMEEKEEVIFVYFYDHATTSEDFAALERLTLSLIGHAKLVKTNSAILADRFKITTWPRLLVSRDGRPTYYTALAPQDMRDFRQVLHWMQSVWLPIVPELTASNSREIMDGKLVVLGILTRERPDEFMIAKKEIKSAALEWMDKQTQLFQLERQELRDAKQLRIEEAEDRNDQRALRAAKSIRISMDKSETKEIGFAWVDGVFWERWIRTTYGIEVGKDNEKVIINDEDNQRYWDTTITGNAIIPSRTSILETIPKVVASPPKIKPKSTISNFEKFFFNVRGAISGHPFLSIGVIAGIVLGAVMWGRGRIRRSRGGFFRLDEKDGLLGGNTNGKVD
jgi:protein disulfide-isomerase